jgi:hypothetical protein
MNASLIDVAFGLKLPNGALVNVEGSALVRWRQFGEGAEQLCVLESVTLMDAKLDGAQLSKTGLITFRAIYEPLYLEDLEWLAMSSIGCSVT